MQRRSRSTATTFAPASSKALGQPARARADLIDGLAIERARNRRDPRQQLPVEDEILAERLACLEPVPGDDVAQRLRLLTSLRQFPVRRAHARPSGSPRPSAAGRPVLAGDVERGAMVGRGADDRQAQRDVDAFLEMERLQRDQRLVMVHAKRRVVARPCARRGTWCRRGGDRSPASLRRASAAMAGSMSSISSRPSVPPSPACGLRPATASVGSAIPKLRCRPRSVVRPRASISAADRCARRPRQAGDASSRARCAASARQASSRHCRAKRRSARRRTRSGPGCAKPIA